MNVSTRLISIITVFTIIFPMLLSWYFVANIVDDIFQVEVEICGYCSKSVCSFYEVLGQRNLANPYCGMFCYMCTECGAFYHLPCKNYACCSSQVLKNLNSLWIPSFFITMSICCCLVTNLERPLNLLLHLPPLERFLLPSNQPGES